MDDTGLDEINEIFAIDNYFDLNLLISRAQNKYIESRIKWIWRRKIIRLLTATKVVLMFSAPEIRMESGENTAFKIYFKQKVMLVGKSELWAHILMKRRI